MKRTTVSVLFFALVLPFGDVLFAEEPDMKDRETVLDRKVHIEKDFISEIPPVPRLCDGMDVAKQRINVGDCELHCEQEGDGPAIVLLHGGPGATHHYFHPWFSRAKDFAKVIYYDQRGCGVSDYKKGDGYSIAQAVEDLDSLRTALKIDRWVVVGHSYGGLLGQRYAMAHPESVAGLVLVDSSPGTSVPLDLTRQFHFMSPEEIKRISEIHKRCYQKRLSMALNVYNAFLSGDWKRQSFYRPSPGRVAQIALHEWQHDTNFNSIMSQDMHRVDLKGAFDLCPIPTLLIEGKWDLTWNTDKPEKLHKNHPRAKLVMFERSSHNPFEDEPERFFDVLRDFVRHLPTVSSEDLAAWKNALAERKKAG